MPSISYNDMQFTLEKRDDRWDISYQLPNGSSAVAGTGLFPGL